MIGNVDPIYWKMAGGCLLIAIIFLFITTDGLVKGKFALPAWVFSIFTMSIGVFLFRITLNSLSEFRMGQHSSLDQMLDVWEKVLHYMTHV